MNDGHFLNRHSRPAHFDRLAFRNAHHSIHSSQEKAIDAFIQSNFEILSGPSSRHRHHRDIKSPRRLSAKEIGLIAVTTKDTGMRLLQPALDLANGRQKLR